MWQASLDPLLGPPEPYDMMSAWPVEARSKVGRTSYLLDAIMKHLLYLDSPDR